MPKTFPLVLLLCSLFAPISPAAVTTQPTTAPATGIETIVILRHGEKPKGDGGMGQLTPQGFNRAIALSTVLPQKFGKPDYLFAPDPGGNHGDMQGNFFYIRPLATIEPTAIRLGMPLNTPFGYKHIDELEHELLSPMYGNSMIFVAWEHAYAQRIASDLMKQLGGDPTVVPVWHGADFDSLYVIRINREIGKTPIVSFTHDQEGLNDLSTEMPKPAEK